MSLNKKGGGPRPAPENFEITDKMKSWAIKTGLDGINLNLETEKFINYHLAKGTRFKNWTAGWRNWMLKALEFSNQRKAAAGGSTTKRWNGEF
jgi:hypothetical protein